MVPTASGRLGSKATVIPIGGIPVPPITGKYSTFEAGYTGSVSRHLDFLLDEHQGILNAV